MAEINIGKILKKIKWNEICLYSYAHLQQE